MSADDAKKLAEPGVAVPEKWVIVNGRRLLVHAPPRTCTCVWPTSCADCEPRPFRIGDRVRGNFWGKEGVVAMRGELGELCVTNKDGSRWLRPEDLELIESASVTEALEDALEREPAGPTKYRCTCCKREHTETQWQCLQWLQFAGAVRSGRLMVSVEVRRCVCANPIARECVLPMAEVLP